MTEAEVAPPPEEREEAAEEEVGLSADLVAEVGECLRGLAEEPPADVAEGLHAKLIALTHDLHSADVADLLGYLARDQRPALIDALGRELEPETLTYLEPGLREEVIEHIGARRLARLLSEMESDDAVEVFEDLEEEAQHRILAALPLAYRQILEESLSYPEYSAGRLMRRELVAVPSAWTVGETIDYLREHEGLPDDFYNLTLVNPKHQPLGTIPLSRVIRTKRPVRLTEIMEEDIRVLQAAMDQEDVAYLFRQYGLVEAPVVDEAGRLIGVVTVDDVVHVIDEEAEDDLLKMAGVAEADLYSAAKDTMLARLPWLAVNLGTAVVASLVIGIFESTLQAVVALAILMPIVASMGGNAGTQTLTVAVRALAMKDLAAANAWRFVGKEVLVGLANGLVFALLTGLLAWFWFGNGSLGFVIAAAMVVNLLIAGLSGTLIPLGLERLGVDPAIASTVFLTTVTDVVGFFAFLGLAAAVLL